MDWAAIREHGIEWYRRQGIDFTNLNATFGSQERT